MDRQGRVRVRFWGGAKTGKECSRPLKHLVWLKEGMGSLCCKALDRSKWIEKDISVLIGRQFRSLFIVFENQGYLLHHSTQDVMSLHVMYKSHFYLPWLPFAGFLCHVCEVSFQFCALEIPSEQTFSVHTLSSFLFF